MFIVFKLVFFVTYNAALVVKNLWTSEVNYRPFTADVRRRYVQLTYFSMQLITASATAR